MLDARAFGFGGAGLAAVMTARRGYLNLVPIGE
jgi:hypothetical protein